MPTEAMLMSLGPCYALCSFYDLNIKEIFLMLTQNIIVFCDLNKSVGAKVD